MTARRILDVTADILMLMALAVAGIGHFLPWARVRVERRVDVPVSVLESDSPLEGRMDSPHSYPGGGYHYESLPLEFQWWHVVRSGSALGVAALLVGISLVWNPRVTTRKLLVLFMFVSLLAAIVFQVMIYSPYPISEVHRSLDVSSVHELEGFYVAFVPTIIACALSLARMGWTMIVSPEVKSRRPD